MDPQDNHDGHSHKPDSHNQNDQNHAHGHPPPPVNGWDQGPPEHNPGFNPAPQHQNLYQEPEAPAPPAPNDWRPQTQPPQFENYQPAPGAQQHHAEKPAEKTAYTPANLILQWLTYAFWGWTIIAMSVLTADVIYSFLSDHDSGNFTAYAIAAVLVLLPISVVTDFFYSKQEPVKKTGPASIILIIHAVIFALFGIGSIITAVFSLVSMATSSGENTTSVVTFFSAIIIAFFYGLVLVRTMDFAKLWRVKKYFTKIMIGIVGVIIVMAIIGPFAQARQTRNDRLLSENLGSVQGAINAYAKDNKALPENLSQLSVRGDAKILIDKNLIKYTPNTMPADSGQTDTQTGASIEFGLNPSNSKAPTYYYTMCATYTKDSDYDSSYGDSSYTGKATYSESPSYYYYNAGENCYKIKTTAYNY